LGLQAPIYVSLATVIGTKETLRFKRRRDSESGVEIQNMESAFEDAYPLVYNRRLFSYRRRTEKGKRVPSNSYIRYTHRRVDPSSKMTNRRHISRTITTAREGVKTGKPRRQRETYTYIHAHNLRVNDTEIKFPTQKKETKNKKNTPLFLPGPAISAKHDAYARTPTHMLLRIRFDTVNKSRKFVTPSKIF
jgi:hypothetical protein